MTLRCYHYMNPDKCNMCLREKKNRENMEKSGSETESEIVITIKLKGNNVLLKKIIESIIIN